jgi:hypothetical protein
MGKSPTRPALHQADFNRTGFNAELVSSFEDALLQFLFFAPGTDATIITA